jgi:hypothetical protein
LGAERFDNLTRAIAEDGVSRRTTIKVAAVGAVGALLGSRFADDAEAAGGRRKCRRRKPDVCKKKNWCEDRTDTCGPSTANGKCFVKRFGGRNMCAEILFQAQTCTDCDEPNCTDCKCILGAGGGDKCNNGPNGFDYVCVRKVAT